MENNNIIISEESIGPVKEYAEPEIKFASTISTSPVDENFELREKLLEFLRKIEKQHKKDLKELKKRNLLSSYMFVYGKHIIAKTIINILVRGVCSCVNPDRARRNLATYCRKCKKVVL